VQSETQNGQHKGASDAKRNGHDTAEYASSSRPSCTDSLNASRQSITDPFREKSRSLSPEARLDRRSPVLRPIRPVAGRGAQKMQSSVDPDSVEAFPALKDAEQNSSHVVNTSGAHENEEVREEGFFNFFDKFDAEDGQADAQGRSTRGPRSLWLGSYKNTRFEPTIKFNTAGTEEPGPLQMQRHSSDKLPEVMPVRTEGASRSKSLSPVRGGLSPVRGEKKFAALRNNRLARRSVSKVESQIEDGGAQKNEQEDAGSPRPIEDGARFAAGGSIPSLRRQSSLKFIKEEMQTHDTKTFFEYRTNVMAPGVRMFAELGDRHLLVSAAEDLARPIYKINFLELSVMMRSDSCVGGGFPPFLLFHTKLEHPRQATIFKKRYPYDDVHM